MNYFNYLTDVEEAFIRRRGQSLFLSPKDWALIESWEKRSIPLHVVIRAVEDVFDKLGEGKKISTIAYCSNAVEEQFAAWSAGQVGASSGTADVSYSKEEIENHIRESVAKLNNINRPEIKPAIESAVYRLSEISVNGDYESLDRTLGDIEQYLEVAMLTNWKRDEFEQIEQQAHKALEPYKAEMASDAYDNTASLMLIKGLRDAAGIPRLGLFYI